MQNNKGAQIFAACAAGGGIGALVALQLSQVNPLMATLGGLVGALIGYLAYDPVEVIAAFGRAFRMATAWRPNWARVKESAAEITMMVTVGLTPMLAAMAFRYFFSGPTRTPYAYISGVIEVGIFALYLLSSMYNFMFLMMFCADGKLTHSDTVTLFKWGNPLTALLWPIIALCWVLYWLAKKMLAVVGFLREIMKTIFVLIHSNARVLCAVDSLIGACVGYFAGSAIIGALVGGCVGLLNYELVSKRLLKLAPAAIPKK